MALPLHAPTQIDAPGESDRALLDRYRAGDQHAASQLYARYSQRLHHLADNQLGKDLKRRIDPEDIVQSVFLSFFRRAWTYDVPEGQELWHLLLVIAANKVRRSGAFHRAEKRDVARTLDSTPLARQAASQEALCDVRLVIDQLLATRPSTERSILELRIDGLEVAQIASETKRAKRTVERVLQRLRTRLHDILFEESPLEPLRV